MEGVDCRRPIHRLPDIEGRDRVETYQFPDPFRTIQGQPIGDARAAIVSGQMKGVVSEMVHQADHQLRHGAFGIGVMAGIGFRADAVAIAGQVRCDDRMAIREKRCKRVPMNVGLWEAMQQQQRRS